MTATLKVMVKEGYAAVTSRRVAEYAGLKAPLIHYHYRTTDDLLLAAYRYASENAKQKRESAVAGDDPISSLWRVNEDKEQTTLTIEFLALANHRKFIQQEMATRATENRATESAALSRYIDKLQLPHRTLPPEVISLIVTGIARALVMEANIGFERGHVDTRQVIRALIDNAAEVLNLVEYDGSALAQNE
ncbi:TetR/AcrR family transcriptional regulator; helix-turn-helix transcriptional regulator [Sphingobium sufflavum]|uniref:TetR/AcrR family transcriptional regulator n=1 Tax=Sphingobium sufflavum TaxID=1129547 RepID=UPI001F404377|nr:TetR/AcrR family transcriptional regulator [Sphingobium sufflavum]MCE7798850.1 TetR/AcrR family transcriptional regulator; helix-turn-helix transcriptional regulator [Sphingobium sufflavum]